LTRIVSVKDAELPDPIATSVLVLFEWICNKLF
jgi:hypothetical protein